MSFPTDYTPVYSHNGATGTGTGDAIDISGAVVAGYPPVMIVTFTGTATYVIQGSHDGTSWVDFSSSLTAAAAKDLVPGVRFWRTKINANSATFTSSVGPVPGANGGYVRPNVATVFASPTF
jgi:hypothetical protein